VAALAAELVEVVARIVQALQEEGEAMVQLEVAGPEVNARAADCLGGGVYSPHMLVGSDASQKALAPAAGRLPNLRWLPPPGACLAPALHPSP
jgi:hypothetical protein